MKCLLFLSVLLLTLGCQKEQVIPADTVIGEYEAAYFSTDNEQINFPINGKTVRIRIEKADKNHVGVTLMAPENGIYSPNHPSSYRSPSVVKNGEQGYYLYLNGMTKTNDFHNIVQTYTGKDFIDYYYKLPDNPTLTRTIRLNKVK